MVTGTFTRKGTNIDRPNILMIMTDQQKATASHLYGNANRVNKV